MRKQRDEKFESPGPGSKSKHTANSSIDIEWWWCHPDRSRMATILVRWSSPSLLPRGWSDSRTGNVQKGQRKTLVGGAVWSPVQATGICEVVESRDFFADPREVHVQKSYVLTIWNLDASSSKIAVKAQFSPFLVISRTRILLSLKNPKFARQWLSSEEDYEHISHHLPQKAQLTKGT